VTGRPSERSARLERPHASVLALVALLVAGIVLRLVLTLAWRPTFLGFPDSGPYLADARLAPFWDPLRTVGYGGFLRILHWLSPHLLTVSFVQHTMGLATAVLLFASLRRCGVPAGVGLVPAAVVLLGGDEIFLEHAVLSESLFIFLVAAALYAAVRSLEGSLAWTAIVGLLIALATTVREAGIVLVPAVAVWVALANSRRTGGRARVLRFTLSTAAAAVVLFAYLGVHRHYTGRFVFTNSGAYNLYGRAAPFADCSKFTPPPGTAVLCEHLLASRRSSPDFYNFSPASPAAHAFGGSAQFPPAAADSGKLRAFARAAIVHQPLSYAHDVALDSLRFVAPDSFAQHSGNSPEQLSQRLTDPGTTASVLANLVAGYYVHVGIKQSPGLLASLRNYERWTRLRGPPMIVLIVLALLSPLVARGRARAAASLFLGAALLLMVVPVLTVFYDVRYAVPGYGPLGAAAALGAWSLWGRSSRQRASAARRLPLGRSREHGSAGAVPSREADESSSAAMRGRSL